MVRFLYIYILVLIALVFGLVMLQFLKYVECKQVNLTLLTLLKFVTWEIQMQAWYAKFFNNSFLFAFYFFNIADTQEVMFNDFQEITFVNNRSCYI